MVHIYYIIMLLHLLQYLCIWVMHVYIILECAVLCNGTFTTEYDDTVMLGPLINKQRQHVLFVLKTGQNILLDSGYSPHWQWPSGQLQNTAPGQPRPVYRVAAQPGEHPHRDRGWWCWTRACAPESHSPSGGLRWWAHLGNENYAIRDQSIRDTPSHQCSGTIRFEISALGAEI